MKKGRIVLIDQIEDRAAAALVVDGRLEDLLLDPPDTDTTPRPGAIYRARAGQPMKGQGGMLVDLGDGHKGYLRQAKGISPGRGMLVQVNSWAEPGKAAPVVQKLMFKSRFAIVTPGAPGLNVARKIRDEDTRDRLLEVAHDTGALPDGCGAIIRSAAAEADGQAVADDFAAMCQIAGAVSNEPPDGTPELLLDAPTAAERAWINWSDTAPAEVDDNPGCFELTGVADQIAALAKAKAPLPGGASMFVEETRAMVAVDVNTGADFSLTAGHKANLAAARDLPRQLRLRGLGGQIVVDFAPQPHKDRRLLEQALRAAFRTDPVETALVGWTGLGHFELQRKRERRPLVVPQM